MRILAIREVCCTAGNTGSPFKYTASDELPTPSCGGIYTCMWYVANKFVKFHLQNHAIFSIIRHFHSCPKGHLNFVFNLIHDIAGMCLFS